MRKDSVRAFSVALFTWLCPGPGCSPAEPPPPRVLHLDFRPRGGGATVRVRREPVRLVPAEERDRWRIDARLGTWSLVAPPAHPGEHGVEGPSFDAAGSERSAFVRRGALDTLGCQRMRLTYACLGHANVTVRLRRDGRTLLEAGPFPLVQNRHPHETAIDLPELAAVERVDELELAFGGAKRVVALVALELEAVALGALLPDARGPPRPVHVGGRSRLAEGLTAGEVLVADVRASEGAHLRLAFGRPAAVARRSTPALLRVRVERAGGDVLVERRVELPGDGEAMSWRSLDLDPGLGAEEAVRVAVELEADGEAAIAVAEARLVVPAAHPPLVFLLTSDTHRADHLGAMPGAAEGVATPALDALAERGVLFANAFSPINLTNPSHLSLLTGVHPRDHGVVVNNQPVTDAPHTLAEAFRDAGYTTFAAVSAKFLGDIGSGLGQGFDRMDWPERIERKGRETLSVVGRWLDEASDEPVFLWMHVYDAHRPYEPPEDLLARAWPEERDPRDPSLPRPAVPERALQDPTVRDLDFVRAQYRAEVAEVDRVVGRLLSRPRFADAVGCFVADHGEALGESFLYFDHGEPRPRVLRIPMVLVGPGLPAGAVRDDPVSHLGVARALLELAGLPGEAARFPERGLLALARRERPSRDPVYFLSADASTAGVYHRGLFLLLHLVAHPPLPVSTRGFERHQVELYDLEADPDGRRDLARERIVDAARLRRRVIAWLSRAEPRGWAGESLQDPALIHELAQLGYVAGGAREGAATFEADGCEWCRLYEKEP